MISRQKAKGQGHSCHSKFFSCPLHGSVPIWPICFILGTNLVHDVLMCSGPSPGQKIKGQGHTGHLKWTSHLLLEVFPCLLRGSVPFWQNHFICGINTWEDHVSCTIFRMKGQRSRSHGSFEVFAVSGLWLPPYLTESLHMWHTYNTCVVHHFQDERSKVRSQGSMCLPSPLCSSDPMPSVDFIWNAHITHEVTTCRAPFPGQTVKVTQAIWSFCCVRSVASSLFDWITSNVAYIQHMREWCVVLHFQDERSKVKHIGCFNFWPSISPLWLHPYLAESLHMWHTYNT